MTVGSPGVRARFALACGAAVGAQLLTSGWVHADDAVTADPAHYSVEFEDDDVRVLRVVYAPGEKSAMHHHPDSVAVYLTGGHIRITLPDGRVGEPRVPPGATMRHAAGSHAIENLGDAPFELVLVELKKKPADPPR